jgi:hypothetical protein
MSRANYFVSGLLLAASCVTGHPFVGTFQAANEIGKGLLELRRDGSFSLDLELASDSIRWQASGTWRPGAENGLVELVVADSRLSPPTDLGDGPTDHLEPGTVIGIVVDSDSAWLVADEILQLRRKR